MLKPDDLKRLEEALPHVTARSSARSPLGKSAIDASAPAIVFSGNDPGLTRDSWSSTLRKFSHAETSLPRQGLRLELIAAKDARILVELARASVTMQRRSRSARLTKYVTEGPV